nr:MAG TPA: hypothetical protein [Caudoviricetes sp.]
MADITLAPVDPYWVYRGIRCMFYYLSASILSYLTIV